MAPSFISLAYIQNKNTQPSRSPWDPTSGSPVCWTLEACGCFQPRDTAACRLSGSALRPLGGRTAAGGRSWWASLSETAHIVFHMTPQNKTSKLRELTIFTLIIDTPWSCSSSSNSSTSSKNLICSRARSFSVSMRSAVGFTCAQARSESEAVSQTARYHVVYQLYKSP